MPTTPYKNWDAITYAKTWCGQQQNSCGVYLQGDNKSDCAHFLAHCLAAGGIVIRDDTGLCPVGLTVRNTTLVPALQNLAANYTNVVEIGLADAIVGDVGFLNYLQPTHAFMICEPFDLGDPLLAPKVYAHSNSRCCDRLDTLWRQFFSTMFRLTDG
jgi:Putative amidase domain